jgi:hypothetical protein
MVVIGDTAKVLLISLTRPRREAFIVFLLSKMVLCTVLEILHEAQIQAVVHLHQWTRKSIITWSQL